MATPTEVDYYEVLGVSRTATAEEIKAAFLKLAGEYQAQGKPANIDAVERFRRIVRAYHILNDSEQRGHYDRLGEAGIDPATIASSYDLTQIEQWASSHRLLRGPWKIESIPSIIRDVKILADTDKD